MKVSKQEDRTKMAARVFDIARNAGAIVTYDPEFAGPREIKLAIEADGLCLGVEFDGDDRQQREGVWVLAWHMALSSDKRLSPEIARAAKSTVNPHHGRKCTAVAYSFEELCLQIGAVLGLVKEGKAFA